MNGKEIANILIGLVCSNRTGLVPMRAAIAMLHDGNAEEFYVTLSESEYGQAVADALAGNGLIPHLLPGMTSPLALTDNQQEYADPERANYFLSKLYGAKADAPNAELLAEAVANAPAPQGSNIQQVLENAAFGSQVFDPETLGNTEHDPVSDLVEKIDGDDAKG